MNAPRFLPIALAAWFIVGCGGHAGSDSSGAPAGGAGGATSVTAGAGTTSGTGGSAAIGSTSASGPSTTTNVSSSTGMPSPPCPCFNGDGLYCETSAEAYASAHQCSIGMGTSKDLLSCAAAGWTVKTACASGCTPEPAGQSDQCTTTCNALTLAQFTTKFTGMCTGFPGWSPSNQCTDLALQWVKNLCLPIQFSGNAINWAGEPAQGFTWVPNAPGIVPSPGDLVVFGPVGMTCNDGVGSAGHVDIAVSASAQSSAWKGFDQNWETDYNGTCYPPQLVNHNWSECVIGWQHLNTPPP
jgi:hypothetical protein